MPKLSSALTPPEKSSDCLPVRTMALSGVMTRMPLVCMSIVASAFQYGWAPTLMPATTMLISPPAWVNSMIRLSARATQSMFSVPESIEMRAPADSEYHSSGTCIRSARSMAAMMRAHSASATEPSERSGSTESTTRVTHCGCRCVGVVELVLDDGAALPGDHRLQLVRVHEAAAPGAHDLRRVVVERRERLGGRGADGRL